MGDLDIVLVRSLWSTYTREGVIHRIINAHRPLHILLPVGKTSEFFLPSLCTQSALGYDSLGVVDPRPVYRLLH